MFTSLNIYLVLGASALFFIVLIAICAYLMNRGRDSSYSADFFGPEYQRDLQRYSDLSETENSQADYQSRFTPFRLRDSNYNTRNNNDSDSDNNYC